MNDYDKIFVLICSRVIDRLGERPNSVIKSFISASNNIYAQFSDGYMAVIDETHCNVQVNDLDLSQEDILKLIIEHAKEHDIYLGECSKIKIVVKGETLEKLVIEYDMKYVLRNLDFDVQFH